MRDCRSLIRPDGIAAAALTRRHGAGIRSGYTDRRDRRGGPSGKGSRRRQAAHDSEQRHEPYRDPPRLCRDGHLSGCRALPVSFVAAGSPASLSTDGPRYFFRFDCCDRMFSVAMPARIKYVEVGMAAPGGRCRCSIRMLRSGIGKVQKQQDGTDHRDHRRRAGAHSQSLSSGVRSLKSRA